MVTSLNTSNGLCMSFEIPSKLHLMFLHVFAFYSSELPTNNMREENLHFSIHLFMSILVATIFHLSSFKSWSHSWSHFLTTMPKATTKKSAPHLQRVEWWESETTRGTITRSVKMKHKPSPLRPSPAKPSTPQHATHGHWFWFWPHIRKTLNFLTPLKSA